MSPSVSASSSTCRSTRSGASLTPARFDFVCWDLYARVTEWYSQDKDRLKIRVQALHDIEHGDNDTAALAHFIADRIVRCHLDTMRRMNIDYDLLTWEGDILKLHFWTHAFEYLKKIGAVFLQTEGRLKGCWVMTIDEDASEADAVPEPADGMDTEADPAIEPREKVIVRSDGTVTYVGKDMAYQLWKFGLLGKDFHYRPFRPRADGSILWSTSSAEECCGGGASRLRRRLVCLQRDRHPPVVLAEAAQAGAGGARV